VQSVTLPVDFQTITDNQLDLFAIIKFWHNSAESPSVVASIPSGYCVCKGARPCAGRAATSMKTNYEGIRVFVRSDFQVKIVNFPTYKSFELLPLFVRIGATTLVLVVVYHPDPASAVTDKCFDDWADVLERTSAFAGCLIM
jgi:hypothetical protein